MNFDYEYSLSQIAASAKVRGDWEQYGVSDWREIPSTAEELSRLTEDERAYWLEVARQ
jgi:hypothetical protein